MSDATLELVMNALAALLCTAAAVSLSAALIAVVAFTIWGVLIQLLERLHK